MVRLEGEHIENGACDFFFFQAEDGIRDYKVTGVQTCALPIFPEGSQWFIEEFGPGFGGSMSRAYRRLAPDLEQEMRAIYEGNVQRGWMEPKIQRYADAAEANSPIDNYLNCMDEVVPRYGTAGNGEY